MERKQLRNVMKTDVLEQRFTSVVMAFTDGTGSELRKASVGPGAPSGNTVAAAQEAQTTFRRDLKYDLEARLLEDLDRPGGGGFFLADMKGPMFSKRLIYTVDPHGAIGVAPEEVGLLTSSEFGYDVTLGFRSEAQRRLKTAKENHPFLVPQQTIDAAIDKNGKLTATAVTMVAAKEDGVRVVPLDLAPVLRVSGVWGPGGEALDFIQEDKLKDASFAVILRKPLGRRRVGSTYDELHRQGCGDLVWERELLSCGARGLVSKYARRFWQLCLLHDDLPYSEGR